MKPVWQKDFCKKLFKAGKKFGSSLLKITLLWLVSAWIAFIVVWHTCAKQRSCCQNVFEARNLILVWIFDFLQQEILESNTGTPLCRKKSIQKIRNQMKSCKMKVMLAFMLSNCNKIKLMLCNCRNRCDYFAETRAALKKHRIISQKHGQP